MSLNQTFCSVWKISCKQREVFFWEVKRQGNLSTPFPFPNKIWNIITMTNTGIVIYTLDLIYSFLTFFTVLNWAQYVWLQLSNPSEVCLFFYESFWFGCFCTIRGRCVHFWKWGILILTPIYDLCCSNKGLWMFVWMGGITISDKEISLLSSSIRSAGMSERTR